MAIFSVTVSFEGISTRNARLVRQLMDLLRCTSYSPEPTSAIYTFSRDQTLSQFEKWIQEQLDSIGLGYLQPTLEEVDNDRLSCG